MDIASLVDLCIASMFLRLEALLSSMPGELQDRVLDIQRAHPPAFGRWVVYVNTKDLVDMVPYCYLISGAARAVANRRGPLADVMIEAFLRKPVEKYKERPIWNGPRTLRSYEEYRKVIRGAARVLDIGRAKRYHTKLPSKDRNFTHEYLHGVARGGHKATFKRLLLPIPKNERPGEYSLGPQVVASGNWSLFKFFLKEYPSTYLVSSFFQSAAYHGNDQVLLWCLTRLGTHLPNLKVECIVHRDHREIIDILVSLPSYLPFAISSSWWQRWLVLIVHHVIKNLSDEPRDIDEPFLQQLLTNQHVISALRDCSTDVLLLVRSLISPWNPRLLSQILALHYNLSLPSFRDIQEEDSWIAPLLEPFMGLETGDYLLRLKGPAFVHLITSQSLQAINT